MADRVLQNDTISPLVEKFDTNGKSSSMQPRGDEENLKGKKSSRKMSEEIVKSSKYPKEVNSSFRSDQSGDDIENKLSSSSEGDVQRGLQFNHKSKVCMVYI